MQSVNYADAVYPVRADFEHSHTRFWQRLSSAGAWFDSSQRIAIARTVREASECSLCQQRKESLSPRAVAGEHSHSFGLDPVIVEVVHSIVTDASRLTRSWYDEVLQSGLQDAQYIEIVGTVVSMVSIDSFAMALGCLLYTSPSPRDATLSRMPSSA